MKLRSRHGRLNMFASVFVASISLGIIALSSIYIVSPARAANGSVAYTYDALGRVVTASYDTGVCIVYTYDPNGNRTSETVSLGAVSTPTWGTGVWGCFNWKAN